MADKGFIKLHRCIWENELVWDERANHFQAWVDLLMLANYKDKQVKSGKKTIVIKRGTFKTSFVKLGARWGWDRRTVKDYILALEDAGMVTVKVTNQCTTINIVNYERYQGFLENDVQQNVQQNVHQTVQQDVQRDVHQNVHNIININKGEEYKESKEINNNPLLSPLGENQEENKKSKSLSKKDIQVEINNIVDESELSQEVKDKLKEFVEYRRKSKFKFFTSTDYFKSGNLKDTIKCEKDYGSYAAIRCIENTLAQGYQGLFFDNAWKYAKEKQQKVSFDADEFLRRFDE